jgi:hypothetical protein
VDSTFLLTLATNQHCPIPTTPNHTTTILGRSTLIRFRIGKKYYTGKNWGRRTQHRVHAQLPTSLRRTTVPNTTATTVGAVIVPHVVSILLFHLHLLTTIPRIEVHISARQLHLLHKPTLIATRKISITLDSIHLEVHHLGEQQAVPRILLHQVRIAVTVANRGDIPTRSR